MQDAERKIPIYLWPKAKVTTDIYQHFGSDTITWVVFNVHTSIQISYIDAGLWEEDTYTFWVKSPKFKATTELCQHFGSDMITWLVFKV